MTPLTNTLSTRNSRWAVALCWLAVAFDGFDLVVLGAVIPTLIDSGDLGFTPKSATVAATVGLIGVGLGALAIGPLTDRFGRRRTLIACVAWFSLFTLLIAVAPSIEVFVAFRFLAGIGLGGCLPIALAFMSEASPEGRAGAAVTRTMTGYHVGAVLTALLALAFIEKLGWDWRTLFVFGAVAGLLVGGRVADKRGNKPSVLAWFSLAAVLLATLSIKLDSSTVLYVAVFVTGFFVFSAQVLVYAFVGHLYPTDVRGTALGFSAGIGRLGAILGPSITGALVTAGIAYPWGFYVFAIAAVIAALALTIVPAMAPKGEEQTRGGPGFARV